MKKIFRSKKQWQKIVFAQPTSGLSISQYCKNKNINISNFYAWRKRLGSNESPRPGFLRLNKPSFPSLRDLRIETPMATKSKLMDLTKLTLQKTSWVVKAI